MEQSAAREEKRYSLFVNGYQEYIRVKSAAGQRAVPNNE
jgi:hypothetical protein